MHDGRVNEKFTGFIINNFRSNFGSFIFFMSPEWSILYGGFIAGTIAFFIGELNVK